ncbi:MAG: PIN domain-containing protein [bacterium]
MKIKEIALDTSILIDHFNNAPSVIEHIESFDILWIPVPAIAELEFGLQKLKNPEPSRKNLESFLSRKDVMVINCTREVAKKFAEIKIVLQSKGSLIPVNDLWIAACCLAYKKQIATRDEHFLKVPDLAVEMW